MSFPRRPRSNSHLSGRTSRRVSWLRRLKISLEQLFSFHIWQSLRNRRRELFALILLIFFSSVLLLALVPGQSRFETRVTTTQMSFNVALSSDETRRRFFYNIRNLEAFNLKGSYPEAITLAGQFTSETLGTLTELSIELPHDYSQIRLQAIAQTDVEQPHDLEVRALQLQDQTQVDELRYVPSNRRLDLQFSHKEMPVPNEGSFLELYIGQQALQLTLEGYRISLPDRILEDLDGNKPLTMTFKPAISELALPLPKIGSISLSLPPLANIDTLRWFWGNLPINQLEFVTEEFQGGDLLLRSAISEGSVRMGDQELDIEVDQFLLMKKPGIQKIRYLKLIEDEGIEVRAVGSSPLVQVGLDPDFPVRSLQSNIIARLFRQDIVVAIVSFSGAMVATLISWFVDNLFKSSS